MDTLKELPKRKTRKESFLGIHFDFHANDDSTEVGENTNRAMVENIIDMVHPDYIQCDCKGHRGLSSYPTRVGNQAPGIIGDPLRVWRDVTAEHGVALYLHYSGVWDTEALKHHPEWARIKEDGTIDPNNTSVFGSYADELLIPQLLELAGSYQVDGVWIDGECWATCQDYGEMVIRKFQEQTGIATVPLTPDAPFFYEFTEFCREGFRQYLRHYIAEVKAHFPDFQIASNWAYSTFMPEEPTIAVDFISGDYPLQNSINAARLEGRYLARQGKPWDLMAWSFSSKWKESGCRSTKTVRQLQQEAAIVLALGGGFQAYFKQKRDGSIYPWQMRLMREIANFCREREALCHNAQAVPQVALLLSTAAFYRQSKRLFSPWDGELNAISGVLRALLDNQYSVEVLSEHHLFNSLSAYPIAVIPEWAYLEADFREKLLEYVRQGGRLLVIGPAATALFLPELAVTLVDPADSLDKVWLEHDGWLGGNLAPACRVSAGPEATILGLMHTEEDFTPEPLPAVTWRPLGEGIIAGLYANIGERYCHGKTNVLKEFIGNVMSSLFPEPLVKISGSSQVDVQINTKNGRLLVNLVNTSGPHDNADIYTFDEISEVGPLKVHIRTDRPIRYLLLQPEGTQLNFETSAYGIDFNLPNLAIHVIIEVVWSE